MPVWAVLAVRFSFAYTRRDVTHLVDMSLHTTREACFTDWAAACGVFIARPASQTLRQSSRISSLDTGDMRYTHDLYGAFVRPMFTFRAASFANKARLLLVLRRSLKIAHHIGGLCEMSDEFRVAEGTVMSAPDGHHSQGIQCRTLNPNLTRRVG
jgi:hypothetical protein